VTDMNYRHWDHYVESIPHPFVAEVTSNGVDEGVDILQGEPYECPTAPFGGMELLDWSPDSKYIAYSCRKKEGVKYAISTDTDIFLYDINSKTTTNLCKTADYQEPAIDATKSMRNQSVNTKFGNEFVGYDTNPKFSPDGKSLAWLSMKRDGYESDRNRLVILDLSTVAGKRKYQFVSEDFDSNVDDYCWTPDSKMIYFIGVWHATENLYRINLAKPVTEQLTNDWADFGSLQMLNSKQILAERHDYFHPNDLYVITPGKTMKKTLLKQVTEENKSILDQLAKGSVQQRWTTTTDGKKMLYWVVLPPHFDANKKYPTLLFCEGGPQSPVSQFWSYRWNMFIMASQGYIVIAPNRRGLPGFGSEWCEEISGDWTGQCMNDYLSAIDDAAQNLPYVDKDRLGCVGASFGGFSVYYLAGHHNKRFKCFIAHDGAFNLESMYTDTEEVWFSNWEYDDAYWNKDQTANARKTYENSPHKFVDKWDTPILCIHGEKDYRINANQGMGAFNAARLRGIPAELLIFPDESHWVLKPQNGILWQRTYFDWLNRWLKK
jgi:dipeptidyl aminopeptidase/acylaminoacyl peptidase